MGKADRRHSGKMRQRKGRAKLKARKKRQAKVKHEGRQNAPRASTTSESE